MMGVSQNTLISLFAALCLSSTLVSSTLVGTMGDTPAMCSTESFSCQDKCDASPGPACSCHHTCHAYDNCCEDYVDHCGDVSKNTLEEARLLRAQMACIDNNLLIAECPQTWVMESSEPAGESNTEYNKILRKLKSFGMESTDIVRNCEEQLLNSLNISLKAPVTDLSTEFHYKNIFCAVCNNVGENIEYWDGFFSCNSLERDRENGITSKMLTVTPEPNDYSNDTVETKVSEHMKQTLLESPGCHILWYPVSGTPNRCFVATQLNHDLGMTPEEGDLSSMVGNLPAKPTHDGHFPTINDTLDADGRDAGNDSWRFELQWEDVDTSRVVVTDDVNKTMVDVKCKEVTSYVEYPKGSGNVYKNKYCFMSHHNYTGTDLNFCEPDFKSIDVGASWYRVDRQDSEEAEEGMWLDNGYWDFHMDVEQVSKRLFVQDNTSSECGLDDDVFNKAECRHRVFVLRFKVNYTFVHSSLIRGDFQDQVDAYHQALMKATSEPESEAFACISILSSHSRTKDSDYEYTSHAEFECVEDTSLAKVNNTGSRSQDEEGDGHVQESGSGRSERVNRYIAFVTNILDTVMGTKKVVTLPVTIEVFPCIFLVDSDQVKSMEGFCSQARSVWKAVRRIDAIIGGISLEGIITIICCILSDIGLLVRLALQNVVPFYKSYPGKIQFNLCLSLLMAYTLFLIGGMVEEGSTVCQVIAIVTHLAFLSALFWMNVTAFEIWRTFRHWRNQVVSRGFVSLMLSVFYAVGIPLLYVITALVVEHMAPRSELSPSYGEHYCWLNGSMAVAIYFVVPCSLICCMNIVFVGLTLRGLRRQRTSISEFKKSNTKTTVTDTAIVVKIILLVGITWLLGLLAALVDNQVLWIIFTVINASLGFMISVVLVINKRVFYAVQNKCLCYTVESTAVVSTQVPRH